MKELTDLEGIIKKLIDEHHKEFFQKYQFNGVGIAFKEKKGTPTKKLSLQFTVEKKLTEEELKKQGLLAFPKYIVYQNKRISVDVVERVYELSFALSRKSKLNPIMPGISVAGFNASVGTIGIIVKDKTTNQSMVLSNWHVLRGINGFDNNKVVQPGKFDDNQINQNSIGKLVRSRIDIEGDCGVCEILNRGIDTNIFDLGYSPQQILSNSAVQINANLVKSGRTTNVTYGTINAINRIISFNFGGNIGVRLINSFEIRPNPAKLPVGGKIVKSGDSGSCWLLDDTTKTGVGLHYMHTVNGAETYAVACYLDAVFLVLDIKL
jgi:endonuclease G